MALRGVGLKCPAGATERGAIDGRGFECLPRHDVSVVVRIQPDKRVSGGGRETGSTREDAELALFARIWWRERDRRSARDDERVWSSVDGGDEHRTRRQAKREVGAGDDQSRCAKRLRFVECEPDEISEAREFVNRLDRSRVLVGRALTEADEPGGNESLFAIDKKDVSEDGAFERLALSHANRRGA